MLDISRTYFDTDPPGAYDAPVMSDGRLPERIDPIRLAEGKRILRGKLGLNGLPRLGAYLTKADGEVEVEMEFGVDEEGIRFVKGRLATEVEMACQRCLGSFRLPLATDFLLGVAADEKAAERLPGHYDPLVVGDEPIALKDVVEDELILSLPIVPKHVDGECPAQKAPEQEEAIDARRENPFAVLAKLKDKP